MSILDYVYGDSTGWFFICTENFASNRAFEWPREAAFAQSYIDLRTDEDVYFSTTLFSENKRKEEFATVGWAVYADADKCAPENFRLPPTISNETSPGKWHCFWVLDKETPATELSELSRLIYLAHKHQGCDGGWIPTKVLRVPGTTNNKETLEEPFVVRETGTGITYTAEQIREAYKDVDVPAPETRTVIDARMPDKWPDAFATANKIPDESWDLYTTVPGDGQSWSERMWRLQADLYREGLTPEEIHVIAWNAKCNKYHPDAAGMLTQQGVPIPERNDGKYVLWKEIIKLGAKMKDATIEEVTPERKPDEFKPCFLDKKERKWVDANPTFIDEYVAWALSRSPDHAPRYSRTLAYQLLSNVYGSYGYLIPTMGPMNLNFWCLIMGPTTETRKSTAMKLSLYVLHQWEKRIDEGGDSVDIGSDFTAEGLNARLAERDGLVSLAHRDEIQGFLHAMEAKSYLAGTKQALTELYDGRVQVSLRSTKGSGQAKRATTIFNFAGLGIRKEMGQLMTAKDFASGFLPRFVWAIADAPPWTPASEYVGQMSMDKESLGEDPAVTKFLYHFMQVHKKFGAGKKPKAMKFSDEAHARHHQWKLDSARMVQQMDNFDLINPSRHRMGWVISKCAALLAIHDRSDTIEMQHLLPVLAQAELWFEDMVIMANTVAFSGFQSKVEDVEEFIASHAGHTCAKAKLYKKFGRKAEVDEYLDNLYAQGRIKRDNQAGTVTALVVN